MSCITEILKLKGDQKIFGIKAANGKMNLIVEGGGTYRGYEYLITFTHLGHRCGYVAVPAGHKLDFDTHEKRTCEFGKKIEYDYYDYEAYEIDCHGGITFCKREHNLKKLLDTPCTDLWLGFDCAHAYDGKDINLVKEYYGEDAQQVKFYEKHPEYLVHDGEVMKDYDFVEKECHSIIDQLIEKAA